MYTYRLTGRPRSSKNSRVTDRRTGRTFVNARAKSWMDQAKAELRVQHGGVPFTGCYWLEVVVYRRNRASLTDNDSPITVVMDCLKHIVVPDDNTAYIGWVSGGTVIDGTLREEYTLVTLREMEPYTIPGTEAR